MAQHYHVNSLEEFSWKDFQKSLNLNDEEMEVWRSDPVKNAVGPLMCVGDVQGKYLILEVIESKGCANGLEVGERLVFENFGMLDPERSDYWCAHAMCHATLVADCCHNLTLAGLDVNENLYPNVFTCSDSTERYGWGLMKYKAYVVDAADIDNYPPLRKQKRQEKEV